MAEWYTIDNVNTLDSPSLVIYPDRARKNIEILKTFVDDVSRLRPHVKTNKCPQVVKLMLDAGISKFKCATIAEAEMLALEGAKDVLLAYQPVGPKARRFCALQRKYENTIFSCLVDNAKSVSELSGIASEYQTPVKVFIDLNVGMNRTGIAPDDRAFALYSHIVASPGLVFMGLHAYDGHLRDADLALRKEKCDLAFNPVGVLAERIAGEGKKYPAVVAGGTPTFPIHAKRSGVEASPGTFIFWDKGYQQLLAEQPFEFAALVVTRVISKPGDRTITVDLGHKSIASENPLNLRVHFLNAQGLTPVGHSEEHLVLQTDENNPLQPGDVLYGVPYHICPTVALYDEAAVSQDGEVKAFWPILSRKRKINV